MARGVEYKTRPQMRVMARAGLVVADALAAAKAAAVVGATTSEVDAAARRVIEGAGATSNFLGYHGFPAVSCVSVNDEVVHGIPGARVIEDGDVVSIDCGAIIEGWHGDSALSLIAGTPRGGQDTHLVEQTRAALWAGIAALASAARLDEVAGAIEDVADAAKLHPLEGYVGHGIGTAMHQGPDVLNYRTRARQPKVKPGMCLALEPMFVVGTGESNVLEDDWTVVSADGSRAAHWEHSVAVHDDGIWVLTAHDGGAADLAPYGVVPVAP
ncbi:type I methionyl aminopeptidase [Demequina sp. TTPB684]|uniref:type I methionyl aminopeptidase n=1 Tax=unclassified Demequina TaxID=2620311 RepID=UPI001CF1599B|nr:MULTISPECIES: type I methionyl aminopeptidase [unclassified Demequina]MCB2412956.1 type I methionyl aminopeptidase [Demequina sp. TTPB684]UPU88417.1 type I methionyl aminopeptidase [Demequina sp. TMPB413]